tara:strand:+ start:972 stop:2066 length:1095 start_codon:yes stop_codon:yes gene_type:complete
MSQIDLISEKIYNHFNKKYPASINAVGLNKGNISIIVTNLYRKKRELSSENISKIIELIDTRFKNSIYGENRNHKTLSSSKHKLDKKSKISSNRFINTNFNPIMKQKENFSMSQKDIDTNSEILDNVSSSLSKKNFDYNLTKFENNIKPADSDVFNENFPIKDRDKDVDMLTAETRDFDYYIILDSKDRNRDRDVKPNPFTIDFSPSGLNSASNGYVSRGFGNIKNIELLDVIVLDTSKHGDSSDSNNKSYPYLLLDFEELGTNYFGTNNNINKTFALLRDYGSQDSYKYYNFIGVNSDTTISKDFNPRINLSKLTTSIKLPDGSLFDFGSDSTSTSNTVINISIRITTIQKNLSTQFVNKATY